MVLYTISLVGCFRDAEIDREKKKSYFDIFVDMIERISLSYIWEDFASLTAFGFVFYDFNKYLPL